MTNEKQDSPIPYQPAEAADEIAQLKAENADLYEALAEAMQPRLDEMWEPAVGAFIYELRGAVTEAKEWLEERGLVGPAVVCLNQSRSRQFLREASELCGYHDDSTGPRPELIPDGYCWLGTIDGVHVLGPFEDEA